MRLLSMLVQAHFVAARTNQDSQHATSPDEVVRQFYDWYLHADFPEPKKQNMAKFKKYITQRFLKRAMAPNVDAVLFIDAQDADPTWANNFSVSQTTIRGRQATAQVTLRVKESTTSFASRCDERTAPGRLIT